MLKAGDVLSLGIEKPAAGGWMIGRADGQVILVSGVIPGERATVHVDRLGKGVAYAHASAIDEPSPDRRVPFVDPSCGGSLYSHIAYERQARIKGEVIVDALGRIGRVNWSEPIEVARSPEHGYRMRARLHVRGGRIGFFREGTHELCDVRPTGQLLDDTCDVVDQLTERLRGDAGIAGELELSENVDGSERVVHLETATAIGQDRWSALTRGLQVTGVTLHESTAASPGAVVLAGNPHVVDVLQVEGHTVGLRRHVQAFFQGNRYLLRDLVAQVVSHIAPNDHVVDLYAGVGLFSVSAAVARGAHVTAVEGDRFAADDLVFNASERAGAVHAVHQSVEMFTARRHPAPSVLIVDPPRTGMSKEALHGAIALKARRIVYVSCDVATLARDVRRVIDHGYAVSHITAFDLFPNTPHVETAVVLQM